MTDQKHYLEQELEVLLQTDRDIWHFLRKGSLDGIWYWDLEEPEHEYMSPEFWQLFGFDPASKKHLASEWQHLIFPEDLELAKENLAAHIADPDCPYDQIVRYRRSDGDVAWVRCRGLAIRDDAGKAVRLLGAHTDITALKRQEADAKAARDELETVFDAASSGILALDKDGMVIRANNKAPAYAWWRLRSYALSVAGGDLLSGCRNHAAAGRKRGSGFACLVGAHATT